MSAKICVNFGRTVQALTVSKKSIGLDVITSIDRRVPSFYQVNKPDISDLELYSPTGFKINVDDLLADITPYIFDRADGLIFYFTVRWPALENAIVFYTGQAFPYSSAPSSFASFPSFPSAPLPSLPLPSPSPSPSSFSSPPSSFSAKGPLGPKQSGFKGPKNPKGPKGPSGTYGRSGPYGPFGSYEHNGAGASSFSAPEQQQQQQQEGPDGPDGGPNGTNKNNNKKSFQKPDLSWSMQDAEPFFPSLCKIIAQNALPTGGREINKVRLIRIFRQMYGRNVTYMNIEKAACEAKIITSVGQKVTLLSSFSF